MNLYLKTASIISAFSSCFFLFLNSSCTPNKEDSSVPKEADDKTIPSTTLENSVFTSDIKIDISDSLLFFSYKGPEFIMYNGEMNDTAHRLSNLAAKITGLELKKLHKEGKFRKVDLNHIVMTTLGMDNKDTVHYTIKIPLIRVKKKCDAYTSFDHSGGWDHAPDLKRRLKDLKNPERTTIFCKSLQVSKLFKTKENLQEYWIQWKNKALQENCYCK